MRINYGLEKMGNHHFEYDGEYDDHEHVRREIEARHPIVPIHIIGWGLHTPAFHDLPDTDRQEVDELEQQLIVDAEAEAQCDRHDEFGSDMV